MADPGNDPKPPVAVREQALFSLPARDRLSPFPAELLSAIVKHVDRPTLVSMLGVNSAFFDVAIHLLYQNLVLGSNKWPKLINKSTVGANGRPIKPLPNTKSTTQPLANFKLKAVKTLDVFAHASKLCKDIEVPRLSNLNTLRLHLTPMFIPRIFHVLGQACPALASLKPETLVIRNAPLVYGQLPENIIPQAAMTSIKHLVIVFTPDHLANEQGDVGGACTSLSKLSAVCTSLQRITHVFQTPNMSTKWLAEPIPACELWADVDDPGFALDCEIRSDYLVDNWVRAPDACILLGRTWVGDVFTHAVKTAVRRPGLHVNLVNAIALDPVSPKLGRMLWSDWLFGGYGAVQKFLLEDCMRQCLARYKASGRVSIASDLNRDHKSEDEDDGDNEHDNDLLFQALSERVNELVGMVDFLNSQGGQVFANDEMAGWFP